MQNRVSYSSQAPSAQGSPKTPAGPAAGSGRFAFIDWYRGLACVLMFETHAYDAWTREPFRQGAWWELARMQLGGFPARMFLFLAGISLMLRYSSDLRKGVPELTARWGAFKRGFEVLLYGLAFRLISWIDAGATSEALRSIYKVDILNCIGMCLMVCSLVVGPMHMRLRRPPLLAMALAAVFVLVTPPLQAVAYPTWLPAKLGGYLWDANPMGSFPLFPWLAYALSGCVVGKYWIRAAEEKRLGQVMLASALLGGVLALAGQLVPAMGYFIYYPTKAVPVPAYPASYVYRMGMVLLLGAASYWWCLRVPSPRFSPLRLLGQASLLVYFVHIELVYGRPTWRLIHRLRPLPATLLVIVLTGLMIALAWWRIEIYGRRKKPAAAPVAPVPKTAVASGG